MPRSNRGRQSEGGNTKVSRRGKFSMGVKSRKTWRDGTTRGESSQEFGIRCLGILNVFPKRPQNSFPPLFDQKWDKVGHVDENS